MYIIGKFVCTCGIVNHIIEIRVGRYTPFVGHVIATVMEQTYCQTLANTLQKHVKNISIKQIYMKQSISQSYITCIYEDALG